MNKTAKLLISWFTGGIIYFYMEIAFRGYSHYSMLICGGICFVLVGSAGSRILKNESRKIVMLAKIMLAGAFIITCMEFITGIIVNIIFKLDVWDYSALRYNVMGQICLLYSGLWANLSLLCVYITRVMNKYIYQEE